MGILGGDTRPNDQHRRSIGFQPNDQSRHTVAESEFTAHLND